MPSPDPSARPSSPSAALTLDLWWLVPGVLAGMSMPIIHAQRYQHPQRGCDAFHDELPALWQAGIRAIVSLLHMPYGMECYAAAGFETLYLPITDGGIPTADQFRRFVAFVDLQRGAHQPVAAHCAAGIGRTGVMLAGYLVAKGSSARSALEAVRAVRPGAVETHRQWDFLLAVEKSR